MSWIIAHMLAFFVLFVIASPFIVIGVALIKFAWYVLKLIGMTAAAIAGAVALPFLGIAWCGAKFYEWRKECREPVENHTVDLRDYGDNALNEFMHRVQGWNGEVVINVVDEPPMKDVTPKPKTLGKPPLFLVK